jgi:hypothetical protein
MLWATRHTIRVNRTATAWLVSRFVDPEAEFCFVEPEAVEGLQRTRGAIGFDAPGARYPHQDARGRCSFEAVVDQYLPTDPALRELGRIVHAADFSRVPSRETPKLAFALDRLSVGASIEHQAIARAEVPAAAGLRAISQGFPLVASGDQEIVLRSAFLYDALYASIQASLSRPFTPT